MVLHARDWFRIPEETKRVAYAAFPQGNVYMMMCDELEMRYKDSEFAELFPSNQGRCAESPGKLALVIVMQYAEGLTDRQAAEAVRARIDWKYALGLRLEDTGFDFSILSDFRERIIAGGVEQRLLEDMLEQFKEKGLLKARGCQRTDSTHVLAAIRTGNRLECVGETMRMALNALAVAVPNWLREQVTPDWFDRYGARFEQYRLPKERKERQELGETIGTDGHYLLGVIYEADDLPWLREIPAVDVLRQIWIQQYYVQDNEIRWRAAGNLPPNKKLIFSPYDIEVRSRTKRNYNWIGYAVHLTETCDPDTPNLITHVETTPATTGDVEMTDIIHQALAEKDLLPSEHFVDTAYVSAEHLVTSKQNHGFDLYGPAPPDSTWQATSETGFDILCFAIDWDAQMLTCPQGKRSQSWHEREEKNKPVIQVRFSAGDCTLCTSRSQCTRAKTGARVVTLKPKAQHKALQAARQRQKTPEFRERYKTRAGVEGTISQGTRSFNLRRSRYIGLDKTRLQHILSAAAMNLTRAVAWVMDVPKAQTRMSHFAALAHYA